MGKPRSYLVTHRELMPEVTHVTDRYPNNRVERRNPVPGEFVHQEATGS
jgi:hypothetical protein